MEFLLSPIVLFFIVVVVFGFKSFIVVPQQEVYVVERLGRFHKALTAGKVDLLDFTAFGFGNARAFFTFGGNLRLH